MNVSAFHQTKRMFVLYRLKRACVKVSSQNITTIELPDLVKYSRTVVVVAMLIIFRLKVNVWQNAEEPKTKQKRESSR